MKTSPPSSFKRSPLSTRNGLSSLLKVRFHRAASIFAACCVTALTTEAAVINNVDFTAVFDATALPQNSIPKWTYTNSGSNPPPGPSVASGLLVLNTSAAGTQYYQIAYNAANPIWNGSTAALTPGTTIEFRMKVDSMIIDSNVSNAAVLYFSTGEKGYSFYISETGITANNPKTGATYSLDTTVLNTYRITVAGDGSGLVNLYVNNSSTPVISNYAGATASTNHIYFGDPSGSTGGQTEWEYFAFTNAGAFAPIPEPTTASLACAVVGLVAARAFTRRQTNPSS